MISRQRVRRPSARIISAPTGVRTIKGPPAQKRARSPLGEGAPAKPVAGGDLVVEDHTRCLRKAHCVRGYRHPGLCKVVEPVLAPAAGAGIRPHTLPGLSPAGSSTTASTVDNAEPLSSRSSASPLPTDGSGAEAEGGGQTELGMDLEPTNEDERLAALLVRTARDKGGAKARCKPKVGEEAGGAPGLKDAGVGQGAKVPGGGSGGPGGGQPDAIVWCAEEDEALLMLIERLSAGRPHPPWKLIAAELGSGERTPAMCRNRYARMRQPFKEGTSSRNRCTACGEIKRGHSCKALGRGGVLQLSPREALNTPDAARDAPGALRNGVSLGVALGLRVDAGGGIAASLSVKLKVDAVPPSTVVSKVAAMQARRRSTSKVEYCLCDHPSEEPEDGVWVMCDGCRRWCHGACVGMTLEQAESVEHFECARCVEMHEAHARREAAAKVEALARMEARAKQEALDAANALAEAAKAAQAKELEVTRAAQPCVSTFGAVQVSLSMRMA